MKKRKKGIKFPFSKLGMKIYGGDRKNTEVDQIGSLKNGKNAKFDLCDRKKRGLLELCYASLKKQTGSFLNNTKIIAPRAKTQARRQSHLSKALK